MDNLELSVAIFFLVVAVLAIILFSIFDKKKFLTIRSLSALDNFKKVFGFSIEQGKRMHISLGTARIDELAGSASLISLNAMNTYAQQSLLGDKPPIITSGSGDLSILSQDIIKKSYRHNNAIEKYTINRAYLSGISPFSYVAGAMPILDKEIATQAVIGHLGPEVGLLLDKGNREGIYSLGATESLTGQATMYAMADEVLIGEEMYAIPAHIEKKAVNNATLFTQDFLRIITIIALLLSALLKLVGIL